MRPKKFVPLALIFAVTTAGAMDYGHASPMSGSTAITDGVLELIQAAASGRSAQKVDANDKAATVLDTTRYLPLQAGNQWNYVNGSYATQSVTVGSAVALPSGTWAIPMTSVKSGESGITTTYSTNDGNGLRRHQEYVSSVYVNGYGYTSATSVYSPPLTLAPAAVTVGNTYPSAGQVRLTYTNVLSATLNYNATTQIAGVESMANSQGTASWSAVKVITSITISGTINGQFITVTAASTNWLAESIGPVRTMTPNASGITEIWKLSSTNVSAPPVITAPSAPTSVVATGANSQATVSFAAPGNNGGAAITSYAVTSSPAGGVDGGAGTTATSRTISGLSNGIAYTFSVMATNDAGTSAPSTPSNSVTPTAPAAPPLTNVNFQGLWWNPSESGWGINFTHQGNIIFATWFTYDASGSPWWLIAQLEKAAQGVYTGGVSTVTGPPFNSVPFPPGGSPGGAIETPIGTMTVTFSTANDATLFYSVNGVTQTKLITKQIFGPLPVCTM